MIDGAVSQFDLGSQSCTEVFNVTVLGNRCIQALGVGFLLENHSNVLAIRKLVVSVQTCALDVVLTFAVNVSKLFKDVRGSLFECHHNHLFLEPLSF